jgi:hypothetical protein
MVRFFIPLLVGLTLLCACLPAQVRAQDNPVIQITELKVVDAYREAYFVAWVTSESTQCQVVLCKGSHCIFSDIEPEVGTLHAIVIPTGCKLTILSIDKDGGKTRLWGDWQEYHQLN